MNICFFFFPIWIAFLLRARARARAFKRFSPLLNFTLVVAIVQLLPTLVAVVVVNGDDEDEAAVWVAATAAGASKLPTSKLWRRAAAVCRRSPNCNVEVRRANEVIYLVCGRDAHCNDRKKLKASM